MTIDNTDRTEQTEQTTGGKPDATPDGSFATGVEWSVDTDALAPPGEEVFYRGGTASVAPGRTASTHSSRPMTVLATFPRRSWAVLGVVLSLLAASLFAGNLAIGTSANVAVASLGGIGLFLASLIALYLGLALGSTGEGLVEFSQAQ